MDADDSFTIGKRAEQRAARHLRWRGWRIVARNWIGAGGELDLIASRWSTLLIVEVRRRPSVADALRSVDRAKLDRTMATAQAYVKRHSLQRYRLRYDIIALDAAGHLLRQRNVLHGPLPAL